MNRLQLKRAGFFVITFLVVLLTQTATAYNINTFSDKVSLSATLVQSTQNALVLRPSLCFNAMDSCFIELANDDFNGKDVVFKNTSTVVTYNVTAIISNLVATYVSATTGTSCSSVGAGQTCTINFKPIMAGLNTGIVEIVGYDSNHKKNTNSIFIGITTS